MSAILGSISQALGPQSIIPPGSQAPTPQQFQQGVQKKLPSKPLAATEAPTPIMGAGQSELLATLLKLSKLS